MTHRKSSLMRVFLSFPVGLYQFEIMEKMWHAVFYIAVLTPKIVGVRFDTCGKPAGVVMASRSAAYMSKFLAVCGKPIVLKYEAKNLVLSRAIDVYCTVARLCYAFHGNRTSHPEPERMLTQKLRTCLVKFGIVGARWNEQLLPNRSVETFVDDVNKCVPDHMIPKDVRLLTSAMRYGRTLL
ncbi:uncharacterized protein LOC135366052 [Ornithodoros turicata]|uniref:uncharacterized protein LOC135366052 n=1 Tax=Ornithodoros turicata TaxID=34597 RepID=UPI0031393F7B